MKLPIELEKDLNELKEKFKRKGYEIKDVKVKKIELDFWDLFYNRTPAKMKNEDNYEAWDPDSEILR